MKTTVKKVLAMVIAAAMTLTVMPFVAISAEETRYVGVVENFGKWNGAGNSYCVVDSLSEIESLQRIVFDSNSNPVVVDIISDTNYQVIRNDVGQAVIMLIENYLKTLPQGQLWFTAKFTTNSDISETAENITLEIPSNPIETTCNVCYGSLLAFSGSPKLEIVSGGSTASDEYRVDEHFGKWTGTGIAFAQADVPVSGFDSLYLYEFDDQWNINFIEVASADYDVYGARAGKTIVVLSENYLNSLNNGIYWFKFQFSGGIAPYIMLETTSFNLEQIKTLCECVIQHSCSICLGEILAKGHILGQENVTIFDCLEVLKNLVGMDGAIENCPNALNAALIVANRPIPDTPTIFDALEILKKLVNMDNEIDNPK